MIAATGVHADSFGATGGILSHDGASTVWVTAALGTVPEQPPAPLADVATPVHAPDGTLVDWKFHANPDEAWTDLSGRLEQFRAWHSQWMTTRAVGDRATVGCLLNWLERRGDFHLMSRLRLPFAHITAHELRRLCWEAEHASTLLNASTSEGIAIVHAATGQLIRGYPVDPEPVRLLSSDAAAVDAYADRLELLLPRLEPVVVAGWHDVDGQVVVDSPMGQLEMAQSAGRLLRHLAADVPDVVVERRPLRRVVPYLVTSLADIARSADYGHSELYVHSG